MAGETAVLRIKIDPSGAVTGMRVYEDSTKRGKKATEDFSKSVKDSESSIKGLKSALAAIAGSAFTKALVAAQVASDRMKNTLLAATGSASLAAKEFAFIRSEAERLGLSLVDAGTSYAKFAAAAKGTALEGQAARDVFTAVAEASTALSLSAEQSEGALNALQQMISKGTVAAEELRGQLGERIPGAFNLAAKAMGVTTMELGDMLQKGEVLATDLLPKLAVELRKTYAGGVEAGAKSLNAEINRLKTSTFDFLSLFAKSAGLAELVSDLSELAKQMAEVAKEGGALSRAMKGASETTRSLVKATTDLVAIFDRLIAISPKWLKFLTQLSAFSLFARGVEIVEENVAKLRGQLENATGSVDRLGHGVKTSSAAMASLHDNTKRVNEVLGPTEEELKAAAKAAKELAAWLKDMADADVDRLHDALKDLSENFSEGSISMDQYQESLKSIVNEGATFSDTMIEQTAFSAEWSKNLFQVATAMDRINAEMARTAQHVPDKPPKPDLDKYRNDFGKANDQIVAHLEGGLTGAFSAALIEFANGGEDAAKHLGENILQVLLNAVAEYLAAMLAAAVKIAAANRAAAASGGGGAGGGGGGGMGALGGVGKAWNFMSGGSALAAVAWAAIAVAAVLAIVNAVRKHAEAVKYGTTVIVDSINDIDGAIGTSVRGKLQETGGKVAEGLRSMLLAMQEASGSLIDELPRIEIKIRNDKKLFNAYVAGEFIGQFKDVQAAMLAAAREAFSNASFAGDGLAPALREVIEGFEGDDPAKLIEALQTVRSIMDEVSGLSEIEIQMRDLEGATAALTNHLVSLGVSLREASQIAMQWKVQQLGSLRDQITGHQQSLAEQREAFERQRALFNAKLELEKLDVAQQRASVAAKIAVIEAGGQLLSADLVAQSNYLQAKADLYGQEWSLSEANLHAMAAANGVSLEILRSQLAALDAAMAALNQINPISAGEFNPGRGRGRGRRGGGSGQSREDKIADALGSLGLESVELASRLKDLGDALKYLQEQGAISAEQMAELGRSLFADILGQMASAIGDSKTLRDLEELRYDIQKANWAIEIERLHTLGAINEEQYQKLLGYLDALPDDLPVPDNDNANEAADAMASLGLESVAIRDKFQDLAVSLRILRRDGAITAEQFRELGDQMFLSLADGLLQYVDDEETRMAVEDLRFQMAMANYRLEFEMMKAQGLLTLEQIALIDGLLLKIDAAYQAGDLDWQVGNRRPTGGGRRGRNDDAANELKKSLDRLRDAIDSLREFQEGLTTSDLSPLTIEQQYAEAQSNYQALLDAAMAGDVEAIEQLPDAVRTLLELAGQMFDPSGAGYAEIFALIQQQLDDVIGNGQDILDQHPYAGIEGRIDGTNDRLDGIWDTLNDIRENTYTMANWPAQAPPGGRLGPDGQNGPNGDANSQQALAQMAQSLRNVERNTAKANVLSFNRNTMEKQGQLKQGAPSGFVGPRVSNVRAS